MLNTPDAPTPPTPPAPKRSRLSRALGMIGLADNLPGGPVSKQVQHRMEETRKTLPSGAKALFRTDGSLITHALVGDAITGALSDKLDLSRAYLVRAPLGQRSISRITLTGADMRRADFNHSRVLFPKMDNADLREIQGERMRLTGGHARKANLAGARLFMSSFEKADLSGTNWTRARMTGTSFTKCNLRGADFTNAVFRKRRIDTYRGYKTFMIDFTGADLTGARFSINARFRDMNLKTARIEGVMLVDAQGNDMPNAQLKRDGSIINHRDSGWRRTDSADDSPAQAPVVPPEKGTPPPPQP
ncbi:MAG: hypothetical protein Alpg2KO_22430 [Alphaproteobacteria bacterium]